MKSGALAIQSPQLAAGRISESRLNRTTTEHQLKVTGARQIWIIAAKEFSDRFRSGWVIACVLVWLGAIGLTSFLGLLQIGRITVKENATSA